jgi:hypothetical protein
MSNPAALYVAGSYAEPQSEQQLVRVTSPVTGEHLAAYIGSLWEMRQRGLDAHSIDNFVRMLNVIVWGPLLVAAITGSTTLLDDKRRGALDLYFTRSLTPHEYLAGKSFAQLAVAAGVMLAPIILYVLVAQLFFAQHPEGWLMAIPIGAAIAIGWALLVVGLALGVSATGRSTAGAVVLVLGAFAIVEVLLWRLLEAVTDSVYVALISPIAGARQIIAWSFGTELPHGFEVHWAFIVWGALAILGWGLLWWRRPRVKGAEVDT